MLLIAYHLNKTTTKIEIYRENFTSAKQSAKFIWFITSTEKRPFSNLKFL
jgi:hypothetical protein